MIDKDKNDREPTLENNDPSSSEGPQTKLPDSGDSELLVSSLEDLRILAGPNPVLQDLTNKIVVEMQKAGTSQTERVHELFVQTWAKVHELSFADDSIDQLLEKIKSSNQQVRIQAAMRLQRLVQDSGKERLLEPLIAALDDPNYHIRHIVPSVLEKIGDPRAINPLISLLKDPDSTIRESVNIALRKFGQAATLDLIEGLTEPDLTAQIEIIKLLGEIRDERALPFLKEIAKSISGLGSDAKPFKREVARAIRRIKPSQKKRPKKPANLTPEESSMYDWKVLLTDWSAALLDSDSIDFEPSPEALKNRWLGRPGATEEQIRQAEEYLGTKLPPSYRSLLKVTNGWGQLNNFIYKLWAAEEVDWFRVRNADWIEAWTADSDGLELPDEEYFVYGDEQDDVLVRREYLATALEISDVGDSGIFLLNPQVVTAEGEWEAWFFANWIPGARRYRSFWKMMQDEYKSFLQLENEP